MKDAPVEIVPYSTEWPALFEREAEVLRSVLQPWLTGAIEHIGSTAVPGLSAKPIIDIMAPVSGLAQARPAIEALAAVSYCYYPYKPDLMHWFCKPLPAHRTHHLHLVPAESTLWRQRLAFREALRKDAVLTAEYQALKLRLANQHQNDREAYTAGKSPYVEAVLRAVGIGAA